MSEQSLFLESSYRHVREAIDTLTRAAPLRVPILLFGESGTGKTTLANWVHGLSRQREGLFLPIYCRAATDEATFTLSFAPDDGEASASGNGDPRREQTIYFDEIAALALPLQAKLLVKLEQAGLETNLAREAPYRVLASTSQDPLEDVARERLHRDLYHRLNVVRVRLPPLRERLDDLLPLARHILRFVAEEHARPVPELHRDAQNLLLAYHWPGNVRELRNEIERALVVTDGNVIRAANFSDHLRYKLRADCTLGGDFTLEEIERTHIERVLARSNSFEAAARVLGIDISTLWRKRKRYEGRGRPNGPDSEGHHAGGDAPGPMRVSDSDAA